MNIPFLILYCSFLIYLYFTVNSFFSIKTKIMKLFTIICTSFLIWSISTALLFIVPSKEEAFFYFKISALGWAFLPGLLLHFSLLLTKKEIKRIYLFPILYIPGLFFLLLEVFLGLQAIDFTLESFGWNSIPLNTSLLFWAFNIYYLLYLISSIIFIHRWGVKTQQRKEKKQARIITIGLSLSLLLIFLNETILPLIGFMVPKIPAAIGLLWIYSIWYSITKYRLMILTPALATYEIISSIQDMMILLDPYGSISKINPRVTEVLDYQEEELRGKEILSFLKEEPANWQRLFQEDLPTLQLKVEIKSKGDTWIPIKLSATTTRDRVGDLYGIVLVLHDLREEKRLQQEISEYRALQKSLMDSNKKLKELTQIKTDFLSTVSHELRTPLTSILGFAQIIKKKYERILLPAMTHLSHKKAERMKKQLKDNIDIIVTEGHRLTKLINDVLDMARIEANKIPWEMEKIDIKGLIEDGIKGQGPLLKEKELDLFLEIQEDLPPIIGDRVHLMKVVDNLICNAIKFTEKGSVTLRAYQRHKELVVEIEDTGLGIPKEELENIFHLFKQIGDTLTDKPKGTGLGLALCKEIIKHHQGTIKVISSLHKGSTFVFTLPFHPSPNKDLS